MFSTSHISLLIMLCISLLLSPMFVAGWGQKYEKARLQDIQVLTLRRGAMTTGRRSSPVPQLSCVGGSGGGRGEEPEVVQCYNRGWDGREVQWECKADMEGSVKFGKVEVVCEGFDYPEDDYILAGSCGLEYSLELTKEGRQQNSYSGGGWGGGYSGGYQKSNYGYGDNSSQWSGLGDLILICVVGIVIYALYKTCIDSNSLGDRQYSSTDSDYPGGTPGAGGWSNPGTGFGSAPGFGGAGNGYDANCGGGARRRGTGAGGLGGFWTGAATGGLMGYMFGNRNNGYGGNRGYRTGYGGGGAWGGGGGGWGASSGGGGAAPASSGTRSASGYGGTRRR